jgi:MFS transporter, ACS family, glucarate transporter
MLTRIVLWWSAFTSLTGTVSRFSFLLLTRFLFGAGEAGAYPNASISIFRWFPAAERALAFGVVLMSAQIGGALSPLLVVPIQARFGWRMSFYLFGIVGGLWAALRSHMFTFTTFFCFGCLHTWSGRAASARKGSFFPAYLLSWGERQISTVASPAMLRSVGGEPSGAGVLWDWPGSPAHRDFSSPPRLLANQYLNLLWLALCYSAITFQQPTVWAICITVGKRFAGSVSGCMNTAANLGAALSLATFGYLVERFGSYDLPLMIMAVLLLAATALWLKIDATEELLVPLGT